MMKKQGRGLGIVPSDDSGQRQDEWNSDEDEEEEEEDSGRVAELKMNDRGAVSPGRIHRGGG